MEAIASMCEADALDFYLAFKVVAKRAPAAPDDPLVASRWAALLAHGAADADARPDAAAAVVAAAWDVARAGVTPPVERARAKRWEATRAAAYRSLARYDAAILVESPASGDDADGASTDGPVSAADLATAYLREPSFGVGSAAEAAAEATYNVARRERDAMARAAFAPTSRRRLGGAGEDDDDAVRAVAAIAAADPLLHRVLKAIPRRLRTMPRLAGGTDVRGATTLGIGPAGAGAHLLLFRPPAAEDDDVETNDRRRASERRARLRRRADAHRRAFRACASDPSMASPPPGWWWHASLSLRSWSRFARRWVDAERDAREDAAGAEARGAALDEARASVADDLLAALRDAPTPDAAQCAALALASPAVLRGFLGGAAFGAGGASSAASASIASSSASIAASATDAIASTFVRGGFDGAERGACLALGVVAGACHAGDRARARGGDGDARARAHDAARDAIGDAAAGAAAEGLGLLARSLGIAVAADGPGAGAWRAEMLRDAASRFDRLRADAAAVERASAASFAVGAATGATFAAMGSDAARSASEGGHPRGDAVAALLSEFIRALERGAAVVVAVATSKDASAEDASAEHASAEDARKKQTLVAATAAAAALPTALAATLAADLPVDDDARRAIRVAAKVAAAGGEHPEVASESGVAPGLEDSDVSVSTSDATRSLSSAAATLRAACCASVGALLDASLSAGVSVPRVLAESATAACASPLTTERDARATRAAAAAMGLAAALGGSWCLAGVRGAGDAKIGFARGLSGPGGARGRAAGEDEAFSTPLLWGGVEGEKSARAAVRALEATASVEGSAAAAAAARGIPLRARETAAWGLALVVDCAVARAGGSAGSVSGTSSAAVTKSGSGTNSGASASSLGGAIGVLAETVLAAPPEGSSPMAPARALSLLARLDRLPAGDWPGALRRWTRASKAISGDDEGEGEGDEDEGDDAAAAAAASIRAACVDFAVAHPGPSAGASLLETLLGAGGGSDAVFDPDPDPDRDPDATAHATALPPAAVCARLDACVAALPPSAASAALRRVVAAASETTRRMNDASASASASVAALWSGVSSAASRLPRGPWTSGEIIDALATLAGSLSRADGPEMDAAVECLSATPPEVGAARVAAPPPTNARRRPRRRRSARDSPLAARSRSRTFRRYPPGDPARVWRVACARSRRN